MLRQPSKVWSEEEEEEEQSTSLDQNLLLFGVADFPTLQPWYTPVWLARFADGENSSRKLDSDPVDCVTLSFELHSRQADVAVAMTAGGVSEQMNLRLAQGILGLMSQDPGVALSNVGGWQSRKDMNFLQQGGVRPGAHGAAVRSLHTHSESPQRQPSYSHPRTLRHFSFCWVDCAVPCTWPHGQFCSRCRNS